MPDPMQNRLYRRFFKPVRQHLERRPIKNFSWIVSWEITHKCNLRCQYCNVHFERTNPDPSKALETVVRLQPHMLLISGGEPLLVPGLSGIIERIFRECAQPHLVITTNLSVHKKAILPLLPYLYTLHVSIDGVEGLNKLQRGIPAEKILANLAEVVKYKREHGLELPQILTATVVTEHNFRGVPRLVEVLYKLDPTVIMTFGTVEPQEHPLSLVHKPDYWEEFHQIFWEMKKRYPVEIVGLLGNRLTRDKGLKERPADDVNPMSVGPKCVQCYRQFFRTVVLPDGTNFPCKPGRYLDYYEGRCQAASNRGDWIGYGREVLAMLRDIRFEPYRPTCYFPCKCEEFMDEIIMARSVEELPSQARFFRGRIGGESGRAAEAFIRKYFNPGFSLELLNGGPHDRS
ncbi:radical SAM protein [bacterium]|nr:radical SAM protein [bacterium]